MQPALLGTAICATCVGMGAFGAHALSEVLDDKALDWWETATQYLWYHGLGFLALGWTSHDVQLTKPVRYMLLPGILLFSGSLYLYAFTGWRPLGMITPIGGVLLIAGWTWLAVKLRRSRHMTKT